MVGLKGEEIPVACRVLAIAEAFDAMTTDRPYRKKISPAEVAREIENCAGTQFDPYLAQSFISYLVKTKIDLQIPVD